MVIAVTGKSFKMTFNVQHPFAELRSSSLKSDKRRSRFNAAMDAVESLVLAHVCSGIDVTDSKYIEGIDTAIDAIVNNLGD